jgi:antitoxin component of MazEF toxin-antitoxin module
MSYSRKAALDGSAMMAIPKTQLDSLELKANKKVQLSIEGNRLLVEPRLQPE